MNDIPLSILFGILAILLLLSAFFSGSETALMTLNRYRLKHLVKQKHRGAIKAHNLLKRPDRLIGLILLGNNFVNILASSIATVIAIRIGGDEAIPAATAILTILVLIFSEVTPKTLAALRPEMLAFISAWLYAPLLKLLYPIVWIVNSISNLLLLIVGVNPKKAKRDELDKDELKSIVSDTDHLLPARYQNMLLSILDLESASVEDIMTQRKEIVGIDLEDSIEDIIEQLRNSPHTRLPVYKKNIDRVIGFLHIRNVLAQINHQAFDKQIITDSLSKPFFIPASTSIHKQMQIFKTEKLRIGLVVDEYGDVQGLVTLDDLLQEIVGELVAEEPDIKMQKDGSYLVDASVTVRELNRITHWDLPTEGPKTLNGLIIEYMETIPEPGTSIKLHGQILEIIQRDENTVKFVRFHPEPEA
ncbi:HlyC/CorC family transporter [Methylomonas sp. SURF-2]|uniref:HlyC/CorC family transporter n=1 Tax=Methylomonas subterranea TaxID=2952225 RepID=A0ABT1TLW3_9GAMM|nr:HlyC/CorC family transporter [Methylomonas sp. SURF-2]MCQ8106097.1 HlyC/CorC family transporter [Methylomonas sp. SURF-2]